MASASPRVRFLASGYARVLFWTYLALAAMFATGALEVYGHDQERFLVPLAVLSALVLFAPSVAWRLFGKGSRPLRVLGACESLLGAAMLASWLGAFGLYRVGIGYDTVVHAFASASGHLIFLLFALARFPQAGKGTVLAAAALALLGGLLTELFEWGGDAAFGTVMYGEDGESDDTLVDLIGNLAGVTVASAASWTWFGRFRAFTRRV